MQITELEPRGEYALKFSANCSALHTLIGEPPEPVRVVIRGYEDIDDEVEFGDEFASEWS